MARIEPKHVARSNNVKYAVNPNNNYQRSCVRLYILQFIYLYYLPKVSVSINSVYDRNRMIRHALQSVMSFSSTIL